MGRYIINNLSNLLEMIVCDDANFLAIYRHMRYAQIVAGIRHVFVLGLHLSFQRTIYLHRHIAFILYTYDCQV